MFHGIDAAEHGRVDGYKITATHAGGGIAFGKVIDGRQFGGGDVQRVDNRRQALVPQVQCIGARGLDLAGGGAVPGALTSSVPIWWRPAPTAIPMARVRMWGAGTVTRNRVGAILSCEIRRSSFFTHRTGEHKYNHLKSSGYDTGRLSLSSLGKT